MAVPEWRAEWDERVIPTADRAAGDSRRSHAGGRPVTAMRLIRTTRHPHPERDRGQSMVEFGLVLLPLFFILLGIIQFGLIFNTYVTITNASREGARIGTV